MFKKSAISVLLAVMMLVSCIVVPTASAAAPTEDTTAAQADNAAAYKLASNVQDGNILHAFNWHFNDVDRYMKDIADAGFTSVQVSPVQGLSRPSTSRPMRATGGRSTSQSILRLAMCSAQKGF